MIASTRPWLVLAAHGSADDRSCARPVLHAARVLSDRGSFSGTSCVFWRERPHFRELYERTAAREIVVVPVMTADGYYARRILRREILPAPAGFEVRITPAVGTRPEFAELIRRQAACALSDHAFGPSEAHLLVVGHGTRRDPTRSAASTVAHVRTLRAGGGFRSVRAAFLEQAPSIATVVDAVDDHGPIVVVPNLVADGPHATVDIPAALRLPPRIRWARLGGRTVVFARAAGEREELAALVEHAAGVGDQSILPLAPWTREIGSRRPPLSVPATDEVTT